MKRYPKTTMEEIDDLVCDKSIDAAFAVAPLKTLDQVAARISGIKKRAWMREVISKVRGQEHPSHQVRPERFD